MGFWNWLQLEHKPGARTRGAKDMAELQREGGWSVVSENNWSWLKSNWVNANAIWKTYTTSQLEQVYEMASVIYACVRRKATTAPQVWMELGTWSRTGWKALDSHPYYDLFRRPNGGQDRATFLFDVVAHLELTGRSYVWKLRNRGGQVIALQPLPTAWVKQEHGRSGALTHYTLDPGAAHPQSGLTIKLEDMFFIQYPAPSDPTRDASPLSAALKELQVDDARADLLIELLTNIHFPGMILKHAQPYTDEAKDEARAQVRDLVGPGKRGKVLFVDGRDTDVQLPAPPVDMDWQGTAAQCETRICAAFGVPPIMIHLRSGLDRSTYSNYGEARKSFYQDSMRDLWDLMAAALDRGLLIEEGETELEFEPDYSQVPEMQEDMDKLHARVVSDLGGGVITLDEAREKIGEAPLPNGIGRVFLRPAMVVEVSAVTGEPTAAPALPEGTAPPEEVVEVIGEEEQS